MLVVSCPVLFSRFGTGLNGVTMFFFSSGLAEGRLGQKCLRSQVEGLLGSRTRLPRGIQYKRHGPGRSSSSPLLFRVQQSGSLYKHLQSQAWDCTQTHTKNKFAADDQLIKIQLSLALEWDFLLLGQLNPGLNFWFCNKKKIYLWRKMNIFRDKSQNIKQEMRYISSFSIICSSDIPL